MYYKNSCVFVTYVFLSVFLYASPSGAEEVARKEVIKKLDVDLVPNISSQEIEIVRGKSESTADRLILTAAADGKRSTISTADRALPHIKNAYSPASYDGFEVGFLEGGNAVTRVVDVQGEVAEFKYDAAGSGGILNFVTKEEDNGSYNFNVQFQYDQNLKKLAVSRVLYLANNESCDRSLLSVRVMPSSALESRVLEDFDGADAFNYLKSTHIKIQNGEEYSEKLMSITVTSIFDQALAAYKKGDKAKLKEYVGYLLSDGGEDDSCPPETYISEKYYFKDKSGWSNDLGFLFAEAGYYGEAAELLKRVVSGSPERVVAYLNLSDAYWGLGNKNMAIETYKKYSALMLKAGKADKIPRRVAERTAI